MILLNILSGIDWVATAGFFATLIGILAFFRKVIREFVHDIKAEIVKNRTDNVDLTNEVKDELKDHLKNDDHRFSEVSKQMTGMRDIMIRIETKIEK